MVCISVIRLSNCSSNSPGQLEEIAVIYRGAEKPSGSIWRYCDAAANTLHQGFIIKQAANILQGRHGHRHRNIKNGKARSYTNPKKLRGMSELYRFGKAILYLRMITWVQIQQGFNENIFFVRGSQCVAAQDDSRNRSLRSLFFRKFGFCAALHYLLNIKIVLDLGDTLVIL